MPRTATGLVVSALVLVASLGLTSVAWSSGPGAAESQLQRPSKQQIRELLDKDAAKLRESICHGKHRRQFRCRNGKPTRWNARNRKLLRSYYKGNDPTCPFWSVARPWTGYATVATEASLICVKEARGTDIAGGTFAISRGPITASLSLKGSQLWLPGGWQTMGRWSTGKSLGGCTAHAVNYTIWILHVRYVVLCSANLFVAAPAFPPSGQYHGILSAIAWGTSEVLINAKQSEPLCYPSCYAATPPP